MAGPDPGCAGPRADPEERAPLPFMAIGYYRFRYKLLIITVFTMKFVNI